ncbi:MAG: helix-turn-helix domain-containing protein, partial [Microbacterium sp.]
MTTPVPRKLSKGERTKTRILEAALEVFSEQGFSQTSVRDIATRADITHVGLMHHFPSKDDMLVRILEFREKQDEEDAARFADLGIDRLFAWI